MPPTALSAVFVTAILLNPDSASRRFLSALPENFEPWQVVLALVLLGSATAVILYLRRRGADGVKSTEDGTATGGSGNGPPQPSP